MNKTFCIVMVLFTAMFFAAGSVFAGTGVLELGSTKKMTAQTSKNVYMEYTADTTTNGEHYGLGTVHKSGDKSYGTTDATTIIYYQTVDTGTTDPTDVSAGDSTFTDWTSF
ncbi:MAG: hypothetical protein JSU72_04265 [Deltaproteobacteria bacterium]|nr:MAG: hypothetical protein JSU72_04265 [Deltaproteobacteria bacterium]